MGYSIVINHNFKEIAYKDHISNLTLFRNLHACDGQISQP